MQRDLPGQHFSNRKTNQGKLHTILRLLFIQRSCKIFFQTLGNYYESLTIAKIQSLKKSHPLKILSIFKGFYYEIINFQEYEDFPPRDFDKKLQNS